MTTSPQSNPIVNFRGDGLTLEKVVRFCEYSIVNMIIDQLKHRTDFFIVDNQISTNSLAEIGHLDIYL